MGNEEMKKAGKRRRGALDGRWVPGEFTLPPDQTADRIGPVEYRDPARLRPHPRNYRTHTDEQIEEIMVSLQRRGQYRTVAIQPDGTILAGHGGVEAARRLGWSKIAVQVFEGTDEEALALLVADNELARMAVDLDQALASALMTIRDTQGDLRGTGWNSSELQMLVAETEKAVERLKEPTISGELSPSLRLGEYHDYIVLLFHRWIDFAWALEHFCVRDVTDNRPMRVKQVGVGRVVDGAAYRRRIMAEKGLDIDGQPLPPAETGEAGEAALQTAAAPDPAAPDPAVTGGPEAQEEAEHEGYAG